MPAQLRAGGWCCNAVASLPSVPEPTGVVWAARSPALVHSRQDRSWSGFPREVASPCCGPCPVAWLAQVSGGQSSCSCLAVCRATQATPGSTRCGQPAGPAEELLEGPVALGGTSGVCGRAICRALRRGGRLAAVSMSGQVCAACWGHRVHLPPLAGAACRPSTPRRRGAACFLRLPVPDKASLCKCQRRKPPISPWPAGRSACCWAGSAFSRDTRLSLLQPWARLGEE